MPDVRRQRGPVPASCARLQSRQFLAHAGDARADQGLVADKPEGDADPDRREGRQPRSLSRLPNGRGRHSTADVPGDSAADRGTAAAAAARASMRRPCSCVHHQTTGGVRPNARKNDQISPSIAVRTARGDGSRPRHPPVLPEHRKSAKIYAGSGSSGETRLNGFASQMSALLEECHAN